MSKSANYYRRNKNAVARGQRNHLSKAQLAVALELIKGRDNKDIAKALFVSTKTVKFHLTSILQVAQVKSRAQFIAYHYIGYLPDSVREQLPFTQKNRRPLEPENPYPDILPTLVLGLQKVFK